MKAKRISLLFTAEEKTTVTTARTSIEEIFQGCRSLTGSDRRRLYKLGDGSEAFVSDVIAVAKNNPDLVPAVVNIAALEVDLATRDYLKQTANTLRQLLERLDHSEMLMGSDIMGATLTMYNALVANGDEAGINEILTEIGKRFARRNRTAVEPLPEEEPPAGPIEP